MPLELITYQDKTDALPSVNRQQEATAADFNEIKAKVNAAISSINQGGGAGGSSAYLISLPSAGTVADRIAGAVEGVDYPDGWVLAQGSTAVDIDIQHSLGQRAIQVSVFAVDGTQEQLLMNTAAYNGIITPDADNLRIQSLATIQKRIQIYIIFK